MFLLLGGFVVVVFECVFFLFVWGERCVVVKCAAVLLLLVAVCVCLFVFFGDGVLLVYVCACFAYLAVLC